MVIIATHHSKPVIVTGVLRWRETELSYVVSLFPGGQSVLRDFRAIVVGAGAQKENITRIPIFVCVFKKVSNAVRIFQPKGEIVIYIVDEYNEYRHTVPIFPVSCQLLGRIFEFLGGDNYIINCMCIDIFYVVGVFYCDRNR